FVLRFEYEPDVDADESAGQCESVDRIVFGYEERELVGSIIRMARESRADGLDIFGGFRVLENLIRVAQPPHDHSADLILIFQGQDGACRAAHVRQIIRIGRGRRRGGDHHRGGEQECGKRFHSCSVNWGRTTVKPHSFDPLALKRFTHEPGARSREGQGGLPSPKTKSPPGGELLTYEEMAERVGFEPTWGAMPPTDFESVPL